MEKFGQERKNIHTYRQIDRVTDRETKRLSREAGGNKQKTKAGE